MDSSDTSGVGLETPSKRRKLEEKNTRNAIIHAMKDEIDGVDNFLKDFNIDIATSVKKVEDEDYKLYRLYTAAIKAWKLLEAERVDLEDGLQPLPAHVERALQSNNDNVKIWSEYFYKNPSPTKIKSVATVPSPVTQRVGGLLHSVASFVGLTAEAVCSNKRKKENFENIQILLNVTKVVINMLEQTRANIEAILEPYMKEKGASQNLDRGTDEAQTDGGRS